MSVKLGPLPKGDANGVGVITRALIEEPHRFHVLLCLVDCSKVTTDQDSGDSIPQARIRRAEVVAPQDVKTAEQLIRRALERRSGTTVLPLEIEDEITNLFAQVNEDAGEPSGKDGEQ